MGLFQSGRIGTVGSESVEDSEEKFIVVRKEIEKNDEDESQSPEGA